MDPDTHQAARRLGILLACSVLAAGCILMNIQTKESPVSAIPEAGAVNEADVPQSVGDPAAVSVSVLSAPPASAPEPQPVPERYEKVTVTATGYTSGPESTGKTKGHPQYGITYSGVRVRRDAVSTIAADPGRFPIGSVLYVPGYGYGVVADTGSAIKGDKIDLYFETEEQVYEQWGKKTVQVLVLKKGDGTLSEEEVNRLNRMAAQQGHLLGFGP